MVVTRTKKLLASVALLGVTGALLSVLLPAMVDGQREHSVAITLKSALSAFRRDHGRDPIRFNELEPLLEEITRWECRIEEGGADHYMIAMSGNHKTYCVDLEYRVDNQGKMEKYHVVDIRVSRVSKRPWCTGE